MSLTKVQINLGTTGNLSGSRSLASGSFASRITTAETELTNTILSSSVQIGTDISGSFGGQRVGTTDSPTFNAITVGTATVTGTLTAQEIHTEFESASILFTSGSTQFGNSSDDVHEFKGNVISGSSTSTASLAMISLADKIEHIGDTNNTIEFGTDEIKLRTGGGSRLIARDSNVELYNDLIVANQTFIGGSADEGYSLLLNIEGAGGTDDVPGILFKNTSASNNEEIMSLLGTQGSDSVAAINIKREANADDAYIDFMTQANGGSMTERLRITSAGHVSASGNISIIKGNAMLNVEEIGGSKAYLFSGGSFTALRTTSNTPIHFGANYSSADDMFIDGSGKVGVNESSFSYTDYSVFHIKGRGSDDSNVTGMTFHVGGTNANSRNWSITTNNSAHGSMDFRVSNANNNTPNTNLVMTMEKDSTIVHKGATQFEGNTTVTADPGKLGVGAAVNSNVGSSMDVIQVGFTSQWYAEKTDSADRNVYIGNNFYHNGSYHRAIYEDQVCGIQFRAGDIKFRTTGSVPTSTNLEAGGGRARMVVHDDGRVSMGYDQTGGHDLEHDSALVVSSSGASGPLTRNAITAVGFCGAGSFNFGQSTVTFDNIKGDGPCFTLRNLGSSHTDRGPFQVYNGSTRILETRNAGEIRGDFVDTSDGDFKQNITTITSSLKEVNKLRPVTYVWKQDEENGQNRGHGQTNIGLIAQEVSESIPQLVTGVSGSSSGLGINTLGVTAVLTKAIQELTQAHKDLRAMITGSSDLGQLKALVSGSSFV